VTLYLQLTLKSNLIFGSAEAIF